MISSNPVTELASPVVTQTLLLVSNWGRKKKICLSLQKENTGKHLKIMKVASSVLGEDEGGKDTEGNVYSL